MTQPALVKRLVGKYLLGDGCWEWQAKSRSGRGYGVLTIGSRRDGTRRPAYAHRLMYEMFVGPIPEGLQIDHRCRNIICGRPDHLEPVTPAENCRRGDGGINNRRKTHAPCGHPYTGWNKNDGRICLDCWRRQKREARRRYLARKRSA